MRIDHLAVCCRTLAEGADHVEAALELRPGPGGRHALMGTHNLLLGLGDVYLEVIAIDPDAPAPARPRWFDLDRFAGRPRLCAWIAACGDLEAEIARGPDGIGASVNLQRGDLRWRMAVPVDGRLPFDGLFPALIEWQGTAHPTAALADHGARLTRLTVSHPDGAGLRAALGRRIDDPRLAVVTGPVGLSVEIMTPSGPRHLA
jgi:hypothetical protein